MNDYTRDFNYEVDADGNAIITEYVGDDANVTVPFEIDGHKVIGIGNCAFYHCVKLQSVAISDSVTSIDECAFWHCISLTNITFSNNVKNIGNYAFDYCISLSRVFLPDSVTNIGDSAFWGCTSLTNIVIPDGVRNVGCYAFANCTNLGIVALSAKTRFKDRETTFPSTTKVIVHGERVPENMREEDEPEL